MISDPQKLKKVVLQCIIAVPDRLCSDPSFRQTLNVDDGGNMHVMSTGGTTVVFDSFSSESEVRARNPVFNSVSKINDEDRRFLVKFNVCVSGSVSAVLSPSTVSSYRVVDDRRTMPVVPPDNRPEHVREAQKRKNDYESRVTEFDLEIERRKRQCALLLGENISIDNSSSSSSKLSEKILVDNGPKLPGKITSSFASVMASGNRTASFASVVLSKPKISPQNSPPRKQTTLMALQSSKYNPFQSSEPFMFDSSPFGSPDFHSRCSDLQKEIMDGTSQKELIAIHALRDMLPGNFGMSPATF